MKRFNGKSFKLKNKLCFGMLIFCYCIAGQENRLMHVTSLYASHVGEKDSLPRPRKSVVVMIGLENFIWTLFLHYRTSISLLAPFKSRSKSFLKEKTYLCWYYNAFTIFWLMKIHFFTQNAHKNPHNVDCKRLSGMNHSLSI